MARGKKKKPEAVAVHSITYDGTNAAALLEFCGGYHMDCSTARLILWRTEYPHSFHLNNGQTLIKDGDSFKVE